MAEKEFVEPKISEKKFEGTIVINISPEYSSKGVDLMKKGGKFYAVYNPKTGLWSLDQSLLDDLIDEKLYSKRNEIGKRGSDGVYRNEIGMPIYVSDIEHSSSKKLAELNRWLNDLPPNKNYKSLDDDLTFKSDVVELKDYRSKRLKYDMKEGPICAYQKLMSVLYFPEELEKLEWAIGSILAGDSKHIDKMILLYGKPGTGKSTALWIIRQIFDGYCAVFSAEEIVSRDKQFATACFKDNPLVMIQDDGSLARITDTKINSIISHESIIVNEKSKSQYELIPNAMLFLATNERVDIHSTNQGITRRFIDIYPTGEKLPIDEYRTLKNQIKFEIPAIAYHCFSVYKKLTMEKYIDYRPEKMIRLSNPMINFIFEDYYEIVPKEFVTLKDAYTLYKKFYEEAGYGYQPKMLDFKEQFMDYYNEFYDELYIDGKRYFSVFKGFKKEKLEYKTENSKKMPRYGSWLEFKDCPSLFDISHKQFTAQYDSGDPAHPLRNSWDNCTTKLESLDTTKEHWVLMQGDEIVFDFDKKDKSGNKSFKENLMAAKHFPETYAELSKSGAGIHLHYIYDGDPTELATHIEPDVEIKVFPKDKKLALRRKLTKCNDIPIATIDGANLPKKEKKKTMVNQETIRNEKSLRAFVISCLKMKHHGAHKPEVDFIKAKLDDYYESGVVYDISDMKADILAFAAESSHQAQACLKLVNKMRFKSEDQNANVEEDKKPIIFYDVEVFINLFVVNWKFEGEDKVHRMINPTPSAIEELVNLYRLIGFNNRRYDNHIMYARMMGYTLEDLYFLSQKIISGKSKDCFFGEAYNLSYTDVYDFCTKKQSLKKWEIELGIHHQELGLPWDQPVPEELWEKVAEYCDNDVIATEAVFNDKSVHQDFIARQILADISGLTVNDTTNKHTERIIFGDAKNPQGEFIYTDLSKDFPGYVFDNGVSTYRGEETGEGGYVYAEPGIYHNIALLDIASMHPTSIEVLNLFGPYTKNFSAIKQARIYIKHKDFDSAGEMFGGKLKKYLTSKEQAKSLSHALKIAINAVYGLTSATFPNAFKDSRNIDNIVAKRGALFMVNLKHEVQDKGFTVAHIKTDSIKIPDATPEIISFVMEYGKKYGYTFEHEATYSKMCLVNDAVYIAQYAPMEICEALYGKDWCYKDNNTLADNKDHPLQWTATGAEFQHPYIFKSLFSKEPIEFGDLCETKTVQTALYLDMNEGMDEDQHNYHFVGRAGSFCPIQEGKGGGILVAERKDKDGNVKYVSASGAKGWRWLEAEDVKRIGKEDDIEMLYFEKLNEDAIAHINEFGSFDNFVGGPVEPVIDFMNKPQQ